MSNHTPEKPGRSRSFPAVLAMIALAVVVVGAIYVLVVVPFTAVDDEVTSDSGIVIERPTGAGTTPEGEADMLIDGVTGQIDEVEPVAPDVDSVPPAERIDSEADAGDEAFVEPETTEILEDSDRNPATIITEDTSIDEGAPGNAAVD